MLQSLGWLVPAGQWCPCRRLGLLPSPGHVSGALLGLGVGCREASVAALGGLASRAPRPVRTPSAQMALQRPLGAVGVLGESPGLSVRDTRPRGAPAQIQM